MKKKFILLCLLITSVVAPLSAEVIVIANKNVPDASFDKETLEKIYLGKKSAWSNGNRIVAVALKQGSVHETFLKDFVKKTTAQFTAYWNQLVFTGKGTPPIAFANEADLVLYVSSTEGTIGYVSSETATRDAKKIEIK